MRRTCCRGERGAQELHFIGHLQCGARARAFVQHRRRQAGDAELARWIVARPRLHEQVDLHERDFMRFDQPHGRPFESVRFWIGGRFSAARGRVRVLCCDRVRPWATKDTKLSPQRTLRALSKEDKAVGVHFFTSGSTTNSTRRSAGNQRIAAAWTSAVLSDV